MYELWGVIEKDTAQSEWKTHYIERNFKWQVLSDRSVVQLCPQQGGLFALKLLTTLGEKFDQKRKRENVEV